MTETAIFAEKFHGTNNYGPEIIHTSAPDMSLNTLVVLVLAKLLSSSQ